MVSELLLSQESIAHSLLTCFSSSLYANPWMTPCLRPENFAILKMQKRCHDNNHKRTYNNNNSDNNDNYNRKKNNNDNAPQKIAAIFLWFFSAIFFVWFLHQKLQKSIVHNLQFENAAIFVQWRFFGDAITRTPSAKGGGTLSWVLKGMLVLARGRRSTILEKTQKRLWGSTRKLQSALPILPTRLLLF